MKKIGEKKKKKKKATIKRRKVFVKGKDLNPEAVKDKIVSLLASESADDKKSKKNHALVCAVIFQRSIIGLMINKEGQIMFTGEGKKMKPLSLKNVEKVSFIGTL